MRCLLGLADRSGDDGDDTDDDVGHTEGVVHSLAICSSAHSGVQGLNKCPSAQVPKCPSTHHLGLARLRLTFM